MQKKTFAFLLIALVLLVPSVFAQNNDGDADVYFGVTYGPSASPYYGLGHDITISFYDEDDWGDGAFIMQFRYSRFFKGESIRLQPEDFGLNSDTRELENQRSFITPREEFSVGLGGRVFKSESGNKEVYVVGDLVVGTARGKYWALKKIREFTGRGYEVVRRSEFSLNEKDTYIAGTLGPVVRARLTDNFSINSKVQVGAGGRQLLHLTDDTYRAIWYVRASVGAEFSF